MEHRWHARVVVPVSAVIDDRDGGSIRTLTKNISYGGMSIEIHNPNNPHGINNIIGTNKIV